jgi:hypothetical protein
LTARLRSFDRVDARFLAAITNLRQHAWAVRITHRIRMGRPCHQSPGQKPSTELRRPCGPSASLRPPLLAYASTDACAPVLGRA